MLNSILSVSIGDTLKNLWESSGIFRMIESGDYKNEFVGGFRVVSFKRSTNGAWNKK